jgi:hypothetical protein
MEICDCGGESSVKAALAGNRGLVDVSGHSAEPQALDKQYLFIGSPVTLDQAHKHLQGHPVIVEDSAGGKYFKRFRPASGMAILESLEIGGRFSPIVLATREGTEPYVTAIWPVLGVLFERPK